MIQFREANLGAIRMRLASGQLLDLTGADHLLSLLQVMCIHGGTDAIADAKGHAENRNALEQGSGKTEAAVLKLPLCQPDFYLKCSHTLVCKEEGVQLEYYVSALML